MSSNAGWQTGPFGTVNQYGYGYNYGWNGGPMAFDIAAIQDLYGANMSYHANADTYVLPDINDVAGGTGTYYTCIWDAGGTDEIVYNGIRNATIDLRAATLDNTGNARGGGASRKRHE